MNKKIKNAIVLSLALAVALPASVSGAKKATAAETLPDYVDGDELFVNEFAIGGWCEPWGTDEDYLFYKENGFNVLYLANQNGYNTSSLRHNIELAREHDLYYMISNGGNRAAPVSIRLHDESKISIKDDPYFLGVMTCDEPLGGTSANVDQVIQKEETGIYKNFNTIYHYLADEYEYIRDTFGNKIFDTVVAIGFYPNDFGYGAMEAMAELVYPLMTAEDRTVSFDSYPCLTGELKCNTGSFTFRADKTRRTGDAAGGAKYRLYYYGQEWQKGDATREFTDERNITYQFYSSMAYGYNMFVAYKYAAYWNSFAGKTESMQNYYHYTEYCLYNKLAVREIKNYDYIYLTFADDWRGTMFLEGTQNTRTEMRANQGNGAAVEFLESHDRIESATSTQDLFIGTFKDKDGRDGFMLANESNPYDRLSTDVEVKFKNATKALAIIDGEKQTVDLVDGVFKATLKCGGGAFVIPYNG